MTSERQQDDEVKQYEPLVGLIEPYIDEPFKKLPETLRQQVSEAFFPSPNWARWDALTPDQRRSFAEAHDYPNDPAKAPEREYSWHLNDKILDIEAKIEEWQLMNPRGIPSEAVIKETELAVLKSRLDNLKKLWYLPLFTIEDWDDLTDAKLAATLEKLQKADPRLPTGPGVKATASEMPEQRRARWLEWYGMGERGAVQRVYQRELLLNPKVDRGFIGKEIKKAKTEQADKKRGGVWTSQMVQDGKR